MGNLERKGVSPFRPGQPVQLELFVGRGDEIHKIMRAAKEVAAGKQKAIFLEGEFGIGKTSLANYMRSVVENAGAARLFGVHCFLATATSVDDVVQKIVEQMIKSQHKDDTTARIKKFLHEYVGEQQLWGGLTLRFDKLKEDAPEISKNFLPFLTKFLQEIGDYAGLFLILDEINGIASNPEFSMFLKSLMDEAGVAPKPVPFMLMVCGTEERRREMILAHKPVERIFDPRQILPLSKEETAEFFTRAFSNVGMTLDPEALEKLVYYSGGLPKMMHILGENAFWGSPGVRIDESDAINAVVESATEVGKKFVDAQILKVVRSREYRGRLEQLASEKVIRRADLVRGLDDKAEQKVDNFLRRMRQLGIFVQGEDPGIYAWRDNLIQLYFRFRALRTARSTTPHPEDQIDEAPAEDDGQA